jgi:hypothetical protein
LIEENKSSERKNIEMLNTIKKLESELAGEFKRCPGASFNYENERSKITWEINDFAENENEDNSWCDKLNDLCDIKSTENNE